MTRKALKLNVEISYIYNFLTESTLHSTFITLSDAIKSIKNNVENASMSFDKNKIR